MSRLARDWEILEKAQQMLSKAADINELRILQSVVFPLVHGMSIQETAQAKGRSPRWVTSARNNNIIFYC